MCDTFAPGTFFIVTGACVKAEKMDRPMAYNLRDACLRELGDSRTLEPIVLSDIWYLNNESMHSLPMISIGGPGVNHVTGYLLKTIPYAMVVEDIFFIQMDVTFQDTRCCIWGMDNPTTVEAVDTFIQKGMMRRMLEVVCP